MANKVTIFGKNTWPHTIKAREAYQAKGIEVDYVDIFSSQDKLESMLKYSGGERKVPVIVDQGKITVGYQGGAWRVWCNRGRGPLSWRYPKNVFFRL